MTRSYQPPGPAATSSPRAAFMVRTWSDLVRVGVTVGLGIVTDRVKVSVTVRVRVRVRVRLGLG